MKISEKFLNPGLISAEDGNTVKTLGVITHIASGSRYPSSAAISRIFATRTHCIYVADLRERSCVIMTGTASYVLSTPDQVRFFCARDKARKKHNINDLARRSQDENILTLCRNIVSGSRRPCPDYGVRGKAHDQMQRRPDRHFLSRRRPGGAAVPLCRLRMPGDCPAVQRETAVSGRDSHAESLCPDAERGGCAFPSRLPQSRTCRGGHPQGNPAFGTGCEKGDRGTQAPQKQTSDGNQEFHSARKSQGVVAADHFRSGKGLNYETHHNHCGIRRVRPASGGDDQNVFAVLKNGEDL